MTTEQATKAIQSHLNEYMDEVPERLLYYINDIINKTRIIIKKEYIVENLLDKKPNLNKEWIEICKIYNIDPEKSKCRGGRKREYVTARVHFVRKMYVTYKHISLIELQRFFGYNDHSSVINLRDWSKVECPYPPFYGKKRFIVGEN